MTHNCCNHTIHAAESPPLPPDGLPAALMALIEENIKLLTRIFDRSKKELLNQFRLYKDQEQLYGILKALISRGVINTPSNSEDLARFYENIGRAYNQGLSTGSKTPTPMSIIMRDTVNQSVQKYVTRLDTDTKKKLGDEINRTMSHNARTDVVNKRVMPQQLAQNLSKHLDGNIHRAVMISRTETMRASNIGAWVQNKEEGANCFIVDPRAEACKYCQKTAAGRVFGIDEGKYLPPYHPHCACVPHFFTDPVHAQRVAGEIKEDNGNRILELERKGYTVPDDGTGPLAPGVKRKSPDDVRY